MGLDTTHGAWNAPYSTFNHFRHWLGNCIGINLDDYNGYKGLKNLDLKSINHPLMPLFDHSDCDGDLSPEECKQIADGLDLVIKAVIPDEMPFSNYQRAIKFRDGCLAAYNANERLLFQ